MTAKGRSIGIGAGAFGGAAVVGLLALGAGVLGLAGKAKVQEATPPVPEQTLQTVKEDVAEAKSRAQEGRA